MIIRTHLTKTDFIKANLVLLYSKFHAKFLTGMGIFLLITSVIGLIFAPEVSSWEQILVAFIMMGFLPLITYFAAQRNYNSNERISEPIEYEFTQEFLKIKGESFTSELSWEKMHKVSVKKDWLLIWQNKYSANVIPKSSLTDNQIQDLKAILIQNNVKNNL